MSTKFTIATLIVTVLLGIAFYEGMYAVPTESSMGDIQRIFYYHFPAAIISMLLFFVNFCASVYYLWKRTPSSDALALAAAEVGLVFCTIMLTTGPLWAKPVWGIWWTWDARLTSSFILWLIYLSYLVLRNFTDPSTGQTPVLAAALAIFGFVDVPIVYLAIRIWRTQHPAPVFMGAKGSGIDPSMMPAVWSNLLAFACLAVLIVWVRTKIAMKESQEVAA